MSDGVMARERLAEAERLARASAERAVEEDLVYLAGRHVAVLLAEYDRRGAALELARLRQNSLPKEPCDCGHPRREHEGHEDGYGGCEADDCECSLYEARGWE